VKKAKVPTWFKARLAEAFTRKGTPTSGGTVYATYADAGYELARHAADYVPEDTFEHLEEIEDDSERVAEWLAEHLKRFYDLVLARRRPDFVSGFLRFREEH